MQRHLDDGSCLNNSGENSKINSQPASSNQRQIELPTIQANDRPRIWQPFSLIPETVHEIETSEDTEMQSGIQDSVSTPTTLSQDNLGHDQPPSTAHHSLLGITQMVDLKQSNSQESDRDQCLPEVLSQGNMDHNQAPSAAHHSLLGITQMADSKQSNSQESDGYQSLPEVLSQDNMDHNQPPSSNHHSLLGITQMIDRVQSNSQESKSYQSLLEVLFQNNRDRNKPPSAAHHSLLGITKMVDRMESNSQESDRDQSLPKVLSQANMDHNQPLSTAHSLLGITQMVDSKRSNSQESKRYQSLPELPFERLQFEDARSYLNRIESKFGKESEVFWNFVDIIKDFRSHRLHVTGVIKLVADLFREHPELIEGFNTFLPPGYRIDVKPNGQVQVCHPPAYVARGQGPTSLPIHPTGRPSHAFHPVPPSYHIGRGAAPCAMPLVAYEPTFTDALSFVHRVEYKFGHQSQVYKDFIDTMKVFKAERIDVPDVMQRVSHMFSGHPELIEGFNTFLPPGYRIDVQPYGQVQVFHPLAYVARGQGPNSLPIHPTGRLPDFFPSRRISY